MNFNLDKSLQLLSCTPEVLEVFLLDIDNDWVMNNEGPGTWSPYDIVGHLLHGELTDWIARVNIILAGKEPKLFATFEREAMFQESEGKSLAQILAEFRMARSSNIEYIRSLNLDAADLDKTGIHPRFGEVTLRQLLSTWCIHDLTHLAQISRVMAKQYKSEMGPWLEYFRSLQ